jgi:uncharacterized glyoxalase superfamily protein PhnB
MAKKKAAKAASRKPAARKTPAKRSSARPARATVTRGFTLSDGAISVTADDIQKSLAWYTDVLGFRVAQRWEQQGVLVGAELAAGDVTMYLSQEDGKKGPREKGQGVRLYWYTNQDIDKVATGIKSRGGTLASEPKDEWGVRSFNLQDPTGYLITVSSER